MRYANTPRLWKKGESASVSIGGRSEFLTVVVAYDRAPGEKFVACWTWDYAFVSGQLDKATLRSYPLAWVRPFPPQNADGTPVSDTEDDDGDGDDGDDCELDEDTDTDDDTEVEAEDDDGDEDEGGAS